MKYTDEELELREEIYNRVIQEHAYLANNYEGDDLQREINYIVDDEFNEENNTLSYDQLMEWDKDDLAHHIISYQEEARRTRNQPKYPY